MMQLTGWKRGIAMVALGGAVLAIGGLAAHGVEAQQTPNTPSQTTPSGPGQRPDFQALREKYLEALAKRLNVSVDQLKQAMDGARQDAGLPQPGQGPHGGRPGGPGRTGGPLATAANAIGISVDQLRQELPGKSIADVARAHNVDPQKVIDALTADFSNRAKDLVNRQLPAGGPLRGDFGPGDGPRQGIGQFGPRDGGTGPMGWRG